MSLLRFFLAAVVAGSLAAEAFVLNFNDAGQPLHWNLLTVNPDVHTNVVNPKTKAIRYYLASDAYSAANATAELNAVRASFAQWQAVPGTHIKFEDAGLVAPMADVNTSDNTNVVFWIKGANTLINGGTFDLTGVLAATVVRPPFADYEMLEADIVLNGASFIWFTDFNNTRTVAQFVEATALHEIGHFLGLMHSPVGGATMIAFYEGGISPTVGLSSDEIAAARALYPVPAQLAALGTIKGRVTMGGRGVLGAVVVAETGAGNVAAATVTLENGAYELSALPPGAYGVRVTPLDPCGNRLVCGQDIGPRFSAAETAFLPTPNSAVTVSASGSVTLNLKVTSGQPPFRIDALRKPTTLAELYTRVPAAATMRPGQSGFFIGVYSPTFPASGAMLTVTGDGLTLGATTAIAKFGEMLLSIPISVAADATPGLRSLVVKHGDSLGYANGFLEILPPVLDYNFDGLDDVFQRNHFPLWTAAQAGPAADPDGDQMNNSAEQTAGTTPTNAASLLRIESVRQDAGGATVAWQSVAGKRYQLLRRADAASGAWQTAGPPVTATGARTAALDATATHGANFYRVQVVP